MPYGTRQQHPLIVAMRHAMPVEVDRGLVQVAGLRQRETAATH